MQPELDLIGEATKVYLENGCNYQITTTSVFSTSKTKANKAPRVTHRLEFFNKVGKELAVEHGKTYEELFAGLEETLAYRNQVLESKDKPYEKLLRSVNFLTDTEFYNRDGVDKLGKRATFNGWDMYITDNHNIIVKLHNAGNGLIKFNALQDLTLIDLNLANVETYGGEAYNESLIKLFTLIKEYLRTPLEERKKELEGR